MVVATGVSVPPERVIARLRLAATAAARIVRGPAARVAPGVPGAVGVIAVVRAVVNLEPWKPEISPAATVVLRAAAEPVAVAVNGTSGGPGTIAEPRVVALRGL